MSSDRRYLAVRSIIALDDAKSIETRPLSEIRTDLEKLGVDPQTSIDAAQHLAQKRSTPADRLMARLDDAEAIDAEIEALEKADIDDVRDALPGGVMAAAAADAKKRAGMPSNVTRLRPSRRVFGWGGSMIGLAACLLLFVVTRPDQLDQDDQVTVQEAEQEVAVDLGQQRQLDVDDEAADQEMALFEPRQRAFQPNVPAAPKAVTTLERLTSQAANSRRGSVQDAPSQRTAAEPLAEAQPEKEWAAITNNDIGAAEAPQQEAFHLPKARPAEEADTVAAEAMETVQALADGGTRGQVTLDRSVSALMAYADEWQGAQAVLIVEPDKAPPELQHLAERLPAGNLADRLDEARRLAGDRDVVALVTISQDGREIDAALAVQPRSSLLDIDVVSGFSASPKRHDGGDLEVIELTRMP